MIENQVNPQPFPSSWTINEFKDTSNQRVVRKFINSAIYVEKAVTEMPPLRKTSPLSVTEDSGKIEMDNISKHCSYNLKSTSNMIPKTIVSRTPEIRNKIKNKIFSRYSSSTSCLGENNDTNKQTFFQDRLNSAHENLSQKTPESGYRTNDQSSNHSSIDNSESSIRSEITVKSRYCKPINNLNSELKLSLSCLNTTRTDRTSTLDPKEKQEIIQNWLARKESEQKHKALQGARLAKQKEKKRQKLIEKERETFKKWLADKKKEEERKKIQNELEEQEQKLRQAEKEKRKVENEISFNLWLRKKKKYELEGKIREKLALLHMYEKQQVRMEENARAYQEWLKKSKTRQKPIPMNKGLQSLCSSASIAYINPLPWTPNIDPIRESSSQ